MEIVQIKPVLVKTKSVRDVSVVMDNVAMMHEGCLVGICGYPGLGKTYTVQCRVANTGGIYVRAQYIWGGSELEFVQALCRELGMVTVPYRKGKCWIEVVDRLNGTDQPVFLDEMQRLPKRFLNICLDLADATGCPVVLVGELELKGLMQENGRLWSRTAQFVEFEPITVSDVMIYAAEATGLRISQEVAAILHRAAEGDFRVVKRSMVTLVQYVNAKGPGPDGKPQVTEEMARVATQAGLKGKK